MSLILSKFVVSNVITRKEISFPIDSIKYKVSDALNLVSVNT